MADGNEDERFLSATSRAALSRDIDRNDQSLDHDKSVCAIVKDSLERDIDFIQDFLQERLPPDLLFDRECQINNQIYSIIRRLLEDIGIPQALDRSRGRISIKVARALYTNTGDRSEAEERVQAYLQSKETGTVQPSETIRISTTPHGSSTNEGSSLSRNKAAVTSTFKEDEKFSGSVSGNCQYTESGIDSWMQLETKPYLGEMKSLYFIAASPAWLWTFITNRSGIF